MLQESTFLPIKQVRDNEKIIVFLLDQLVLYGLQFFTQKVSWLKAASHTDQIKIEQDMGFLLLTSKTI